MLQNRKSIADALLEVQLKVNENKRMRAAQMAEEAGIVDEGLWDAAVGGAVKIGKNLVKGYKVGAGGSSAGGGGQIAAAAKGNKVGGSFNKPLSDTKVGELPQQIAARTGKVTGQGAKVVADNPGKAGLAAGAVIGAGATAALKGGSSSDDANAAETKPIPQPQRRPADLDSGNSPARAAAPAARAAPASKAAPAAANPDPKNYGSFSTSGKSPYGYAASGSDEDTAANFFASSKRRMDAEPYKAPGGETESGGKSKGKKKMSESMIEAFLALQNTKAGNVFEAAKKLKGNQDKLDKNHNGKLDKQDFKMLRGEKMEEASKPDFLDLDKDGNKKESMKKAAKETKSEKIKAYRADRDKNGEMEESIFSEAELEHIASILEINDQSVSARQLTDEETEAPAKRGRGRPAGSRSGSTYGDEGPAEPKRVAAQIRDVKSYFNNDKKEVVKLTHPTKGSTHEVGIKAANDFNRDYAGAGKPEHKDSVESAFVKKHMGG